MFVIKFYLYLHFHHTRFMKILVLYSENSGRWYSILRSSFSICWPCRGFNCVSDLHGITRPTVHHSPGGGEGDTWPITDVDKSGKVREGERFCCYLKSCSRATYTQQHSWKITITWRFQIKKLYAYHVIASNTCFGSPEG